MKTIDYEKNWFFHNCVTYIGLTEGMTRYYLNEEKNPSGLKNAGTGRPKVNTIPKPGHSKQKLYNAADVEKLKKWLLESGRLEG